MPLASFEELNRRQGEAGRAAVRQRPQRGGRAACARRTPGITATRDLTVFCYQIGAVEGGPRLRTHTRDARVAARSSASRSNPNIQAFDDLDDVFAFCERDGERNATRSATTSTASS